jgi:RNA polymerase sigma-70 factor (ECF subfamily)
VADPVAQLDDAVLAARAQGGDQGAFAALYQRRHGQVFGYFRARVLDTHLAEDLSQEVFLRVYNALSRFNTDLRFQSWLMGICRNVLREHVRGVKKRREIGWTELCLDLEGMVGDESVYDDVLHLVPLCLAGLGDSAAKSLHWHYMGGMKVQDIANRLSRTLGATKVLMVRARQALKRCIKSHLRGASEASGSAGDVESAGEGSDGSGASGGEA